MEHLKTTISTAKEHILGESIFIQFTIKNISEYDIALLIWNTPLEGIQSNIFKITKGKNYRIPYDGKMIKRGSPNETDYVIIKSGKELSKRVDITDTYFLDKETQYKVELDTIVLDYIILDDDDKKTLIGHNKEFVIFDLNTKAETFIISKKNNNGKLTSGMQARQSLDNSFKIQSKIDGSLDVTLSALNPNFIGGSPSQHSTVKSAHQKAHNYTKKSISRLNNPGSTNTHYRKWFGMYNSSRYSKVKSNYSKMNNSFNRDIITYDLTGSGCGGSTYAYTYKGTRKIWLCSLFWSAPNSGVDTKFGTIIHEMSHCVALVDDIVYGTARAKELARTKPSKAIKNADNHEYFSETL